MARSSKPREGSLQFWPRTRGKKFLPRVNWKPISLVSSDQTKFLGFIGYKVGMKSSIVKDNTEHSLTKGKKIAVPSTILEVPPMKIFSIKFYKHNKQVNEILIGQDKELKKKVKLPKKKEIKNIDEIKDYDDLRVLVYSQVKETGIKKTPDLIELALSGTKDEKIKKLKEFMNKEIRINDVFQEGLVDLRGLTKGKGTQGPTKKFGLKLRDRKSEKGQRGPGSIGPWHPARITFRAPMAGQMGFFTRLIYNNKILGFGSIKEKDINPEHGWTHYGKIKTDYLILKGNVQGPAKRQILITPALRKTKKQEKKKLEFMELR